VLLTRFRSSGGKKFPNGDPEEATNIKARKRTVTNNLQVRVLALFAVMFLISRVLLTVSPRALNYIDESARNVWLHAERAGIIEPFQNFSLEYHKQFPGLNLLEDNWQVIRNEAEDLLATKRKFIPRLKDLYVNDPERAAGRVYKTDWKTCELYITF
jgi:hypothetical protein